MASSSTRSTMEIRDEAKQLAKRIESQAASSYETRRLYDLLSETTHLIEEVAQQVDERFESWSSKQRQS